jgi:nitrogen-specific signal transduction histidine kinase
MAAAQAVLVETDSFLETITSLETIPSRSSSDELVCDLIHDLRQPLSSIEAIAYYLEMTLPPEQIQARLYMRRLQQLVDQTSVVLGDAAACMRKKMAGAV